MMEVTRFGGPEVLRLRIGPDPVPGPGQAVIDVAVVPVLFLDTALRRGEGRDWFPLEPPYVPGSGVAGTVRAVGDGVEAGRPASRLSATPVRAAPTPIGSSWRPMG